MSAIESKLAGERSEAPESVTFAEPPRMVAVTYTAVFDDGTVQTAAAVHDGGDEPLTVTFRGACAPPCLADPSHPTTAAAATTPARTNMPDPTPPTDAQGCPFCDTEQIAGELEFIRATGDRRCMVFKPLDPVTPGHLLVVPEEHVEHAAEAPRWTAATAEVAALVARRYPSANIITSIGAPATQTIRHLHLHVVPRVDGDGLALPWSARLVPAATHTDTAARRTEMRGTGGNRVYDGLAREGFAAAVLRGLDDLARWAADTGRTLDLARVSVDTMRTNSGRISLSVTADLADGSDA